MWVKVPTAATSVVCSAGLVAALALPVAMQEAPEVAKDLGVKLSVNWGNLDAFNALPLYGDLLIGDSSAYADLASLSGVPGIVALLNGDPSELESTDGIPAYVEFLQTGSLDAFRTTDGPPAHRGVDLLNALPLYQDLFSGDAAARDDAYAALASVSAVPAYAQIAGGDVLGGLNKLDSTNAVPKYAAALAGDPSALTGLATLDGVPALAGALGGDLTALRPAADGSGGYAALSAIPEYLGLGPSATAATVAEARVAPQNEAPASIGSANPVKSLVSEVKSALGGAGSQSAPEVTEQNITTAGEGSGATTTGNNNGTGGTGSYSASFAPKIRAGLPFLVGSGGSQQEGMRGYGKFLKKLGIGGSDPGDGTAAGDGSGE